jgi:serine/threonine protein kinase
MVTGIYPFEAKRDDDLLRKIIDDPMKFPSNITISKSGYNLLDSLFEKNQHLRIEANDNLFDEWYNDM